MALTRLVEVDSKFSKGEGSLELVSIKTPLKYPQNRSQFDT